MTDKLWEPARIDGRCWRVGWVVLGSGYRCRLCNLVVDVLTVILRAYLAETSMDHLAGALKMGGIKDHTDSVLDAHFCLQVVDWWTHKQNAVIKEDITKAIKKSLEHEDQHERRRDKSVRSVSGTHSWLAGNASRNYDIISTCEGLCKTVIWEKVAFDLGQGYDVTASTRLVQCQRFMFFGAHADEGQAAGDLTEDDGGGPHGTETENKQKKLFNGLCNFVVPKLAVIGPSPRTKVAGQGGIVEKKRKREVRSRDATASRENIRTNTKSKGRSSEPSHRVNQTLFLVSWNGSEETHEITPDIYTSSGGPSSVGVIGNGEYRRLPQWAAGPAKLNYDPATLAQVPKASKRSSPLRNWRDGLWSSEGDGGGEGYPSGAASLREKNWRKRGVRISREIRRCEERPYRNQQPDRRGVANPPTKSTRQRDPKVLRSGHMTNTELKRRSKRIPPQSQPDSESMVARERWPAD
ncbi:hypothetical protein EDB84DRAFT_1444747 [Lactarius hengduanensis]|nr:hypothetical protein EDB84DRAFT_1444747 [Lactarius hengduanensis]